MRDIAQAAGVSQSTVSRILSNAPLLVPVSEDTRQRVVETSRRLGYRPNPMARALRGARTMLLGAVVRDITDPFFASAVEALTVESRARGYNIVLGNARGLAEEVVVLAGILEARHCDAIVLLGDVSDQPALARDLRDAHLPVVAMWQGTAAHELPSVNVDNAAGVRDAVEHLVALGHRRIAFVQGRPLGDIRERAIAFEDEVGRCGLDLRPGYVQQGTNTPDAGESALTSLLALSDPPTAVVASTDVLAFGILHAAHAAGIVVPRDVSVVGFDDIPMAAHSVPALTTLRMPIAEMVAAAVEMAISGDGPDIDVQSARRVFQPRFVVRDSTAAVARA
jgi:DNA-binding LacI/PurR family transcriptional regulator